RAGGRPSSGRMAARLITVSTSDRQTDEGLARPPAWRYWRQLPPKGRMGIFFGNWYSQMLQDRVKNRLDDAELDQSIEAALRLERMLCDEGALIFMFWFHLSREQLEMLLKRLSAHPSHRSPITPAD